MELCSFTLAEHLRHGWNSGKSWLQFLFAEQRVFFTKAFPVQLVGYSSMAVLWIHKFIVNLNSILKISVKLPWFHFRVLLMRVQSAMSLSDMFSLSPVICFFDWWDCLFPNCFPDRWILYYFEVLQIPVDRIISLFIATSFPLADGPACL